MVFTDPPYNVRIEGNVSGLGAAKHREFAMASGELCGKLWNCTDQLPAVCHGDVEALSNEMEWRRWKRTGGTYGIAARIARYHLKRESTVAAA